MKYIFLFLFPCIGLGQLKLKEALSLANQNNLSLKSQKLAIPITDSDLKKAKLFNNPIFNVQYLQLLPSSSQYNQNHGLLHPTNSQDWFQLTKRFQVFGQRLHRIDIARMDAEMSRNEYSETARELSKEVAMKWIDAWQALAYKNLALKAADYLDSYLKDTRDSSKRKMKEDEKLRFEILDDQYDLQLGKAEQEYHTTLEDLKLLLGTRDSITIDINDTSETVLINLPVENLLASAKENRQDLKKLETLKKQSGVNVKYQKSLAIPQPEAGFVWNPQNTIPYAGVYFTQQLPFFDRNHTEVQKAKLSAQSSELDYQMKLNKLTSEVSVSFYNYNKSKQLVRNFSHNLIDSEKLLSLVKRLYLRKENTIVDIWEAEQTWFQSYTLYYNAFVDYRKNYVTLLYELNILE